MRHVFRCAALAELPEQLQVYDASTARDRHTALIREFLGVTPYGPAAREVVVETCMQAARRFARPHQYGDRGVDSTTLRVAGIQHPVENRSNNSQHGEPSLPVARL
jgi:hypothetical protein